MHGCTSFPSILLNIEPLHSTEARASIISTYDVNITIQDVNPMVAATAGLNQMTQV
jgi:hypothetical protein